MSELRTALSILRQHMAAGDHRAALKLAASWPDLGTHRDAIRDGWEACRSPQFYRDIGGDPDAMIRAGVDAIRERYKLQ